MNSEIRSIILTLLVSASVTLAVEYEPHLTRQRSAPLDSTTRIALRSPAETPLAPRAATVALTATTASLVPAGPPAPAERGVENSPPEEPAAEMPVALHIRNRRDLNLIDGDIRNVAGKPLSITLRAVSSNTQGVSEIHLQLAPGERKTYSTHDGLDMQTDDQLIVQSPPYLDRIVRVP